MANLFWNSVILVVIVSTLSKEVYGACQFPSSWNNQKWMLSRTDYVNRTLQLITYAESHVYTSSSVTADVEDVRYTCDDFSATTNGYYYIRSHTEGGVEVKTCVVDTLVADVILHRETTEPAAVGSLIDCLTALANVELYSVYTKVSVTPTSYELTTRRECPFEKIPYQVTFKLGQLEECVDRTSSVMSVAQNNIAILSCNYELFPRIPLTGILNCISTFNASYLGEVNEDNGGVLILQWSTTTQKSAFVYCVRYKQLANRDGIMSIDLSATADLNVPADVACQRNARYDESVTRNGREYVRYNLNFQQSLVSSTFSPTSTTRATPRTSPSVTPAPAPPIHVQFALNLPFIETPNDRESFTDEIRTKVAEVMSIDPSRIGESLTYQSSPEEALLVVTFDVLQPTDDVLTRLENVVNSGQFAVMSPDGQSVTVKSQSYYNWRDTDPCSTSTCEHDGNCTVLQGTYACDCPEGHRGVICDLKVEPSTKNDKIGTTTIAIIVVCCVVGIGLVIGVVVFVIKRQNSSKANDSGSEAGYDNGGSIDDRDREMYSTINKKPKAYHDRSFTNLDENKGNGELTGIHL